jgi:hypothetical protein
MPWARAATPLPHDEVIAGQQDVGGPQNAVNGRLARAVVVVEQVLGVRVIYRDDRVAQRPIHRHGPQADDPGGCLLHPRLDAGDQALARRVQRVDEVGAVVNRDRRLHVQHGVDVLVVHVLVFAMDGENGNAAGDQVRRGGILRAQRIAGAQRHVCAPGRERLHEVDGLGGDVQASGDALARERLALLKAFANEPEH